MHAPPIDEQRRLHALHELQLLDTPAEPEFDEVVELARGLCDTEAAAVSLVDEHRQWFKARAGLAVPGSPREHAFCAHAIEAGRTLIVENAALDARFRDNPFVTGPSHVRFYAGVPLVTHEGHRLGALCVIDSHPRTLEPHQRFALEALARQVETQLDLRRQLNRVQARERQLTEQYEHLARLQRQKDELAALVVHDLGSPLAAILAGAQYLQRGAHTPETAEVLGDIATSAQALRRMAHSLLDVAQAEDGKLPLKYDVVDVTEVARSVVSGLGRDAALRHQRLMLHAEGPLAPVTDELIIRRVLENLVQNALKYSPPHSTVTLSVAPRPNRFFELCVADEGPGIPVGERLRIFDKFARLDDRRAGHLQGSRGLGLTFCRMAVSSLAGTIAIEDHAPHGTVFRVSLPGAPEVRPSREARPSTVLVGTAAHPAP